MLLLLLAVDRWWLVGLASGATLVTLWLLVGAMRASGRPTARRRLRDRRERREGVHADPGEALALVGDALAATHNPRALLPVILEVVTEATGALGGQIFAGGEEVAWIGGVGGDRKPLSLGLGFTDDGETTLLLFPEDEGL